MKEKKGLSRGKELSIQMLVAILADCLLRCARALISKYLLPWQDEPKARFRTRLPGQICEWTVQKAQTITLTAC